MKSYHQKLRDEGYLVTEVLGNHELEKGLVSIALDSARGMFSSVRIVPSDIAFKGEGFKPDKECHLVYAVYNSDNPEVRKEISRAKSEVLADMTHLESEDGATFFLNIGYREIILKLAGKAGKE